MAFGKAQTHVEWVIPEPGVESVPRVVLETRDLLSGVVPEDRLAGFKQERQGE